MRLFAGLLAAVCALRGCTIADHGHDYVSVNGVDEGSFVVSKPLKPLKPAFAGHGSAAVLFKEVRSLGVKGAECRLRSAVDGSGSRRV